MFCYAPDGTYLLEKLYQSLASIYVIAYLREKHFVSFTKLLSYHFAIARVPLLLFVRDNVRYVVQRLYCDNFAVSL